MIAMIAIPIIMSELLADEAFWEALRYGEVECRQKSTYGFNSSMGYCGVSIDRTDRGSFRDIFGVGIECSAWQQELRDSLLDQLSMTFPAESIKIPLHSRICGNMIAQFSAYPGEEESFVIRINSAE